MDFYPRAELTGTKYGWRGPGFVLATAQLTAQGETFS